MSPAMQFSELGLIPPLLAAVAAEGYTEPTPIQQRAIPHVLAGKDLLGLAQTGTGKTAAFALPILQRLNGEGVKAGYRKIRCLILTPTRELASQIDESFKTYGKNLALKSFVIFGGVGMEQQKQALRAGMDVLVATPGRLLDLSNQRLVDYSGIEVFVLDEADRMLDMGFIHDVKRVIAFLPRPRQTLFFSATMPREAQELADQLLIKPETVAVTPPATTAEKVDQEVYFVDKTNKRNLLVDVLRDTTMKRVLVFSRTKHGANRIAEHLMKASIGAMAIHGNKSQSARERALADFKAGKIRCLVATDIAARGIDIDDVTHVVNFDVPEVPETYVHRIGRTARAGASGMAMTFCDAEERTDWRNIGRLTRQEIAIVEGHPFENAPPDRTPFLERPPMPPRGGNRGRSGGGGGGRSFGGGGGAGASRPPLTSGGAAAAPAIHSGGGDGGGGGDRPAAPGPTGLGERTAPGGGFGNRRRRR